MTLWAIGDMNNIFLYFHRKCLVCGWTAKMSGQNKYIEENSVYETPLPITFWGFFHIVIIRFDFFISSFSLVSIIRFIAIPKNAHLITFFHFHVT